tara:strand:- start:10791 stop:11534 length:744 start_codon:yes stop_codon:yes gene_type:complete
MDKLNIPPNVTGPEAPTEESVEPQTEAQSQTEQVENQRPEWLPEKFKNVEDLAKAYGELESKLGSSNNEIQETQQTNTTPQFFGENAEKYTNEFTQNGNLSEESIKEITESGIPREYVDAYIKGQQAMAQQSLTTVYNEVGGEESYKGMMTWAEENLSETEINAYNNAVESGDMDTAMMAVRGLHARFGQTNGQSPSLLQGNAGSKSSTSAYRSLAELTKDMRDPRYEKDPAYRQDVQNRLAVSNVF